MPLDTALALLKPLLEDPAVMKIGQNMKYDAKIFARLGIHVAPIDDTMLMSYAMHAGMHNHGMDYLSETYLGHKPIPIKELIGSGKTQVTFDRVEIDDRHPIRRRGCRCHPAPVADLQAAVAPGESHHRLRDPGTPPRARSGRNGDGRHSG